MGKIQKFSTFSGRLHQKVKFLFEQWASEVRSVMQSDRDVTLREGIL